MNGLNDQANLDVRNLITGKDGINVKKHMTQIEAQKTASIKIRKLLVRLQEETGKL